jgi:hypothetical protein
MLFVFSGFFSLSKLVQACTSEKKFRAGLLMTEGVWLSVTPMDDALIVMLNFERPFGQLQSYQGWLITQLC